MASIGLNLHFHFQKKHAPRRQLGLSAEELLADILRGQALVKITRVSPEDVFLWSPKGR
jgi:hypothetical protein